MQEQDRFAMGPDLRLSAAQYPRTIRLQFIAGCYDVFYLITNMMHAAGWIALQELCDWRVIPKGM